MCNDSVERRDFLRRITLLTAAGIAAPAVLGAAEEPTCAMMSFTDLEFFGADGVRGTDVTTVADNGVRGNDGYWARCISGGGWVDRNAGPGSNGGSGATGLNGGRGGNGADGPNAQLSAGKVTSVNGQPVLARIKAGDGGQGGKGGKGGTGGAGGNGGGGTICGTDKATSGNGGHGGPGGNGGNGGAGGDGGKGSAVTLTYPKDGPRILTELLVSQGGVGGAAGEGGDPGNPGVPGATRGGHSGQYGVAGPAGRPGTAGSTGQAGTAPRATLVAS